MSTSSYRAPIPHDDSILVRFSEPIDVASIDLHARRLEAVEHAHPSIGPALADPVEDFVGDRVERVLLDRSRHACAISGLSSWSLPSGIRNWPPC